MIILTIRTDKPEAELGLYDGSTKLTYFTWQAHRQLAETIHKKIYELLKSQSLSLKDVRGIVVFQGPGSFTGLRIGLSVANALAYGFQIPIVAGQGQGWIKTGINKLGQGQNDQQVMPEYGAPPHVTKPKH